MYIYKKAGFENPDFFYTQNICVFFFSYTLQQHFHWEIGFFTLCHFLLAHADTSLSVCLQPRAPVPNSLQSNTMAESAFRSFMYG